jgi:hypothetical protein
VEFELSAGASPRDALRALADAEAPIESFTHLQPSLREMFVRYASTAAVAERRTQ